MTWCLGVIGWDLKMVFDKLAQGLMTGFDMAGLDVKLVLDKVDLKLVFGKEHQQALMSYLAEIQLRLDLSVVPDTCGLCFGVAFARFD